MNETQFALLVSSLVAALVLYVWIGLSLSAVFRKAGEPPWQAWVPVLNAVVVLRMGGLSGLLVLLVVIPLVGAIVYLVVMIVALLRINKAFGLGVGMTVLGAILFPVWASVVGWGSARWLAAAAPDAPARRRASADDLGLESPVTAPPTLSASATPRSVFGAHGPAGGPDLPPRPAPPTTDGFPSVVPAPVGRGGMPLPQRDADVPADALSPVPAFRSTMQGPPVGFVDSAETPAAGSRAFLHSSGAIPHGPRPSFTPDDFDDTEGSPSPAGPPVSARPSGEIWAPPAASGSRPPAFQPLGSSELTYESSAEVSAVQGAPTLGAPRSARTSVSAQHRRPEIPDEESFDETIVTLRRRTIWTLVPALGTPVPLTAEVVVLGRRPQREPDYGDAQLIAIPDETRTVSKTHARMELTADGWTIIDLDSTNGVILIGEDGTEADAAPGRPEPLTARFLLGDAEFSLRREGE